MNKKLFAFLPLAAIFAVIGIVSYARAVTLPGGEALFETSLQDRISSTDTSMTLVANSLKGSQTISGYHCWTIDEGRSDQEFVCGSISGTAVTSLERGISLYTGTSTIAALQKAHRKGADVKITDYPLVQILRNLLNGIESFPNLLAYVTGTACSVSSANGTICDKAYIDGVAVAGASNANETTKGIGELATQVEMASSTLTGSTGANLLLYTKYSTSSPYTAGLWSVVTQNDGKISPNFIATSSTYSYNWAGLHVFSATTTMATSTTASSSVTTLNATILNVGTSTGTSTYSGNVAIAKNASTTNLTISNACTGCSLATQVTNTVAYPTASGGSASVAATCTGSKLVSGGGYSGSASMSLIQVEQNYPSASNAWTTTLACRNGGGCGAGTLTVYAICVNP